jgi:hypothetical protein
MSADEILQNGLDIDDWDAPIYRVLPIKYFKVMIEKKKLVLVRPALWQDPFDNFFLKSKVKLQNGQVGSLQEICDKWYGICWTKNRDSDAMWRIYSPKKDGVRVSTTIRKLFSEIYKPADKFATLKYFIGSVQYKKRSEIEDFLRNTSFMDLAFGGQADRFARTLCMKRCEFLHESEVRLLFQDVKPKRRTRDKLRLSFDYAAVLNEATLDPRLEEPQFEAIKSDLIRFGCTLPITQSDLYKIDEMTIKLW